MEYKKYKNKIVIHDLTQFNINQILDCGQIFRYYINDNIAEVVTIDKYAQIVTFDDKVEITTDDVEYFEHFFDLNRDYNNIKNQLINDEFLAPAIRFGYGIRILNQNLFEMIVSFIISANNNIKRIKNSLNHLSQKFGTKVYVKNSLIKNINDSPISFKDDKIGYYTFPTLEQLKRVTVTDFVKAGLGYRAEYMYNTIQKLNNDQLNDIANLDDTLQLQWLLSLKGVGEKVAHCIMLFALHNTNVFPVDTWINKVYNDLTNTNNTNRTQISKALTNNYQNLSGYAQQYFFYYYRSK
ncbi:MAG: DNA-3-methyladenine glycosylase family protein [Clostridia bacterium]